MSQVTMEIRSWRQSFSAWLHPKAIAMLFLGFSAGIPILLIFSTLSVWLREAGVDRAAVTFFSWAALGYSFKFLWAPLIDLLPLPYLTRRLGRRRGWLIVAQLIIISAILWMSGVDPATRLEDLTMMALAAVLLGFSSATQDIVIDAYRIESAEVSMQAMLSSMYIAGYRMGMLVAGAGSLVLAEFLSSETLGYNYQAWRTTYMIMGSIMGCGIITTLSIAEPDASKLVNRHEYPVVDYLRFLALFLAAMGVFALTFFKAGTFLSEIGEIYPFNVVLRSAIVGGAVAETLRFCLAFGMSVVLIWLAVISKIVNKEMAWQAYYAPIKDFFLRYGGTTAFLILALIGFYRLSDITMGVVSNVFYLDMGFSKSVIAGITKSFGLGMTLVGGFLGGMLTIRYGVQSVLFLGALLSAATNLLFMLLATAGNDVVVLTMVIAADNLSAGIATTAFIAFLSSLTNISFTAVQYAIFSSMMTLFPKVLGGYSGNLVSSFGYETFFLMTAVMGIPVLGLIIILPKITKPK